MKTVKFHSCQVWRKGGLTFHLRKFDINKKFNVLDLQLYFFFESLTRWGQIANSCEYKLYVLSCSFCGHAVSGEMIVTLFKKTVFCGLAIYSSLALRDHCFMATLQRLSIHHLNISQFSRNMCLDYKRLQSNFNAVSSFH